jgi:predicted nucleic acid-binding protein
LNRLSAEGAIVPDFWNLEVVNALLVAQRRSVMSTARCRDFLARLGALPILAQAAPSDATHRIFDLSGQFGLTAYDASYLDLALRTGSPLATFDRRLADACGKAGVVLA